MEEPVRTICWKDDAVVLIDQRALPLTEQYLTCTDYREILAAIKDLTVRGAPAIGVAAAMGIALGALRLSGASPEDFRRAFDAICAEFAATRPTARNLFWAIERMKRCCAAALACGPEAAAKGKSDDPWCTVRESLTAEAIRIGEEDIAINRRLGQHGREPDPGQRPDPHPLQRRRARHRRLRDRPGRHLRGPGRGKTLHVYADETRPVLQGARLTAWELMRGGIRCTLIADNMAGSLMQRGGVDLVIVGADRIAANGDTANKIGTYPLAVLAQAHGVPFYVAAPLSTIDPSLPDGGAIPIEERNPDEMTHLCGVRTAPEGIEVWNPAFDVTPNRLIAAIVTEAGVIRPPFAAGIRE